MPPICRTCRDSATGLPRIRTPKNICDFTIYKSPILIKVELKSSSAKSISLDNKIIKKHQYEGLEKINNKYPDIYCGFIFNFYNYDNQTYFVNIKDFMRFLETTDRKSIPLDHCKEVGIEIENKIIRTRYKYDIEKLIKDLIPF